MSIAVAYVRRSGTALLDREIQAASKRGGRVRVLTCFDFGFTEPAALESLLDGGVKVRVAELAERAWHPKVYLGRAAGRERLVVGSANLTAGGLLNNVEGAIAFQAPSGEPVFAEASAWFEALWDSPEVLDCPRGLSIPQLPRRPRTVLPLRDSRRPAPAPAARPLGLGFLRDSRAVPGESEEFDDVWEEVLQCCPPGTLLRTATGRQNRVLQADPERGLSVWVMARAAKLGRREIVDVLRGLLDAEHFDIDARDAVEEAVGRFAAGRADFADYLLGVLGEAPGSVRDLGVRREAARDTGVQARVIDRELQHAPRARLDDVGARGLPRWAPWQSVSAQRTRCAGPAASAVSAGAATVSLTASL